MTYIEMETRTISLCIAALQSRDSDTMRRALVKILADRSEMMPKNAKMANLSEKRVSTY